MFGKTKLKTLGPAEASLTKYEKTEQAIAGAVAGLQPLIEQRQSAERNLRDAEIAATTGEGGNLEKSRKQVDGAHRAIDEAAGRLRGLRGRLIAGGGELASQHELLAGELPSHHATIREQFAAEWTAACEVFGKVLSKRAALEQLTGNPLDLPQPAAGPHDLGEMARPSQVLDGIRAAIQNIAELSRTRRAAAPMPGETMFDPQGIYQLRHAAGELQPGTLVLECSFPPGELAQLVSAGWAIEAQDPQEIAGRQAARNAARKLKADADAEEARKRQAAEAILKAEIYVDAERRDPRLKWRDGMERKDPNERTRAEFNADEAKRRARPAGPAAQVAADRAAIEAMIDHA